MYLNINHDCRNILSRFIVRLFKEIFGLRNKIYTFEEVVTPHVLLPTKKLDWKSMLINCLVNTLTNILMYLISIFNFSNVYKKHLNRFKINSSLNPIEKSVGILSILNQNHLNIDSNILQLFKLKLFGVIEKK